MLNNREWASLIWGVGTFLLSWHFALETGASRRNIII
jgi:hypothetical protein